MLEYILIGLSIAVNIYLFIRINKMATSLETLQQRVTDLVTALDQIKAEVTAMKTQTITQDEVNTEMDLASAKVNEIEQVINPGQ